MCVIGVLGKAERDEMTFPPPAKKIRAGAMAYWLRVQGSNPSTHIVAHSWL